LGAYLRQHGVLPNDRVGIFMETCPDYVTSSIGALKAGGAFTYTTRSTSIGPFYWDLESWWLPISSELLHSNSGSGALVFWRSWLLFAHS